MSEILIQATVAQTSKSFIVNSISGSVTLISNGLSSSEEIELQIKSHDNEFVPAYNYSDQEKITLKSNANVININIPGCYRVVKGVTSVSVVVGAFWEKRYGRE